ncbi:uncharacterized protein N7443_010657 [Penicillium atrosanguineum]|uniref:uncharacterized protein n=1 Tax=Penicillium atrosanguineum TaxID=1132637 RepID=UPI002396A1B2|nr:uncharacterized protein N7443_010657 [Penicillium atrosanguineum]KAJ5290404.1 hypothetical protein N7443_010657 [Penicillium atrosanguineum]
MVNVPGRSRGCSTCRRRKIKCDESFPECLQCIKNRSQCSGPRTGAFFVHALPDRSSRPVVKHTPAHLQSQTITRNHKKTNDLMLWPPSVVSILQPDRTDIFDQLFVSRFIESFGFQAPAKNTPSPTWLDELAAFLTLPAPSFVKHSIRAGTMFFYGSLADDVSIKTEACRWYTRSLKGLQDLLSKKTSSFTGDVICAVVMLAHFENLAGTSKEAWFQHVRAAARMLESGGAESCREGFLHQLFRHLRLLVFVASIFKNEEHVFSSPQWTEIPFELYPKGPFDRLVDILFVLLPCLTAADKLIKLQTGNAEPIRTNLRAQILGLVSQLHHWWTQCTAMMNFGELKLEAPANSDNDDSDFQALDPNHFPILHHSDMPTAALAALYDAANIYRSAAALAWLGGRESAKASKLCIIIRRTHSAACKIDHIGKGVYCTYSRANFQPWVYYGGLPISNSLHLGPGCYGWKFSFSKSFCQARRALL